MKAKKKEKACQHLWRIFHDSEAIKTGNLTFFCQNCLTLKKVVKTYPLEAQA